jgi:hypothetical protein
LFRVLKGTCSLVGAYLLATNFELEGKEDDTCKGHDSTNEADRGLVIVSANVCKDGCGDRGAQKRSQAVDTKSDTDQNGQVAHTELFSKHWSLMISRRLKEEKKECEIVHSYSGVKTSAGSLQTKHERTSKEMNPPPINP